MQKDKYLGDTCRGIVIHMDRENMKADVEYDEDGYSRIKTIEVDDFYQENDKIDIPIGLFEVFSELDSEFDFGY